MIEPLPANETAAEADATTSIVLDRLRYLREFAFIEMVHLFICPFQRRQSY